MRGMNDIFVLEICLREMLEYIISKNKTILYTEVLYGKNH